MADTDSETQRVDTICESLGLSKFLLLDSSDEESYSSLRRDEEDVTNGLVLELLRLKEEEKRSFADLTSWIDGIVGHERGTSSSAAVTGLVKRLKSKRSALLKNGKTDDVSALLSQQFLLPMRTSSTSSAGTTSAGVEDDDSSLMRSSTERIAAELVEVEQQLAESETKRAALQTSLARHRSSLKNTRQKLARRDDSLASLQSAPDAKAAEVHAVKKKLTNEHHRVYYYQSQVAKSADVSAEMRGDSQDTRHQLAQALARLEELQAELEDCRDELKRPPPLRTMTDHRYTDEVRKCCLDLLSRNVGVWNVAPVVRSVLELVGLTADRLPSVGLLSQMLVELKQISAMQVAEAVTAEKHATLHSDGTTKYGKKYGCYQIATESKVYSVGMVNMKCGTAEHVLDKLKEALADVEGACCESEQPVAATILARLKNTMSDRSIVQKKFNDLLQQYRESVLPGAADDQSDEEQTEIEPQAKRATLE